jgi:polysaccharide pyruvyl transferase WcaK-like protein
MIKICIIGWYGTETIGDRAILAGLLALLGESFGNFEVEIGSIYPFYTEQALAEDLDFMRICSQQSQMNIPIFDVRQSHQLDTAIRRSDIVVIGGGPLMDTACLFMLEYAMIKAKKQNKRTMVLGCGIGPLNNDRYKRSTVNIIRNADVTVFRDERSKQEYECLAGHGKNAKSCPAIVAAIDPAVFAIVRFVENVQSAGSEKDERTVVCIREFPKVYHKLQGKITPKEINNRIISFISHLQQQTAKRILLLPMMYFAVGGDDREFMNRIGLAVPGVDVQNTPLTLCQTMQTIFDAPLCVGMRFHSIVFQTMLGGKNIILDYTDPAKGKIINFINQMGITEQYKTRYICLTDKETLQISDELYQTKQYKYDNYMIKQYKEKYLTTINSIIV